VHYFPSNGWRICELAEGMYNTIVKECVLLEGARHTGTYPGCMLRNAYD